MYNINMVQYWKKYINQSQYYDYYYKINVVNKIWYNTETKKQYLKKYMKIQK